jgi:hypothetical protein
MYLVEVLLPLRISDGAVLDQSEFICIRKILTDRFGGLTAFTRARRWLLGRPEGR